MFVVLIAEQCLSTTSALLSNRNHKYVLKFISVKIIYEGTFLKKTLNC